MAARRKREEKVEEPVGPTVLQRLVEEQQQRSAEEEFASDVSVLFCGSKRSGKTSIVDRFINPQKDEKDQPKATVALEYKFARYASDTAASKVLAHIYDLGGDESNEGLTNIPISSANVGSLVLALTVDLGEPHTVAASLDRWLRLLRDQVHRSLDELARASQSGAQRVQAITAAKHQLYENHPDRQALKLLPVPMVIFATKWDVLASDADPEKRKGLARALRYFAHTLGANLVFCSLKDKTTMNNARGILRQLLFGVTAKGGIPEQLDPSKPICVAAGKDSLGAIGAPGSQPSTDRAWSDMVSVLFPDPNPLQKGAKKSDADALSEELVKFPESAVDGMVEQRIEELNQYRRQVERNQRLASEGVDSKVNVLGS
eukprot:TRINITY_DN63541_c0_g1_i1.p1 TRINITY_DN63541_c0_g1~~TRINITY_DN63541_c0_g1_i1.p1  ORF type:complete len:413 (+),score=101.73 TRINITY_DN63541_c0_g1_i1:115-1239(+)